MLLFTAAEMNAAFPIHTVFPKVLDGEYNVYDYKPKKYDADC